MSRLQGRAPPHQTCDLSDARLHVLHHERHGGLRDEVVLRKHEDYGRSHGKSDQDDVVGPQDEAINDA